ncbi:MAG: DUF465 domain-containing protein [Bdellovibrionota bacterium]|nr:MAG: DUF465 domain-containing protein [Bdellovibrionota bacterium]
MGSEHHPLGEEFPEFRQKIHYLKQSDAHFRGLCDRYEEIDKQIARSVGRIDLHSEAGEEKLRKERLALKDEILLLLKRPA